MASIFRVVSAKWLILAMVFGLPVIGDLKPVFAQAGVAAASSSKVPRALQTFSRLLELPQQEGRDSNVARFMDAYYHGKPTAMGVDGKVIRYAAQLGLATCDWTHQAVEPAYTNTPMNDEDPFIDVQESPRGEVVGSSPIEVADGLWCDLSLCVIDRSASKAQDTDFLVGSVSLRGGKPIANQVDEPAFVGVGTLVDFWSETNSDRITLGGWQREGNQLSTPVYGPLLYRVLSSQPEYLLIGDRKITLSKRFRKACLEICTKVNELRVANGQADRPAFRDVDAAR